ncbi:13728_t:CDS:2 [Funneliformis mosseae]|uniref:13728_t:CDS:1 n=1 Tax=Funneliformis mosseae TaxID=27381 RepID=A0A9N9GG24_FUNMO|nr:13728_t:CDS:2 [Funneliformis mosseae]
MNTSCDRAKHVVKLEVYSANLALVTSDNANKSNQRSTMDHKGANNVGSTNNDNVDNSQRDTSNNGTRDFYMPQSEPPGTSLPDSSPTPSSTTPLAAFVNKLYTMVEDQSIQHLISWAPSGDVFSVSNPTEFSKSVLPQYFKHNNWQSFVRQLNMYGFHKVNDMFHANPSSESQAWEFKHPDFRRGQLLALQNIKRKSSKPANSSSIKGNISNSGTGQSPSTDNDALRDDRIDILTTQMSEMVERMRQMSENYGLLYAETVSCRMLQSKHQQVITAITNLLASMSREDDTNDPRSLKRKFEMDLLQAEVAKLGQADVPQPSHSPIMQHPTHYPRDPGRSISNPQPMCGVEHTPNMHHNSQMSEVEYRMPYPANHRQQSKVQTSSPLAMLPEMPFTFQPSNNYLRHRSPEPIPGVNPGGNSRSASMDTYNRSVSMSSSHAASPQYSHTNSHRQSHSSHMSSSLPSPQNRRPSQPASSLSFGSDSNLLNPPENNRYKDNNSIISHSQSQQQRPPTSSSTSPSSFKSENPVVNNPLATQIRAPPLSDPPENNEEYKRRKRN